MNNPNTHAPQSFEDAVYLNDGLLNDDNRVNTNTLRFGRNRHNRTVVLGETLACESFFVHLDDDKRPSFLSGFGKTVFDDEDEKGLDFPDKPYTLNALGAVEEWLEDQVIPDFKDVPLVISNVRYMEEHPICRTKRDVVVEITINEWDSDVILLTNDYQDVQSEDEANMLVFLNELELDEQEKYRAVYREIADRVREHIQANPYHRADSMLSYYMEYGTKYVRGDDSKLIRYDIPVVTYKSVPKTEEERKANAVPARLVVNRKDSYWEACLYANEELWSKSSQDATPLNGGFGDHVSHNEFLRKVQTVYMFVSGVAFDFISADCAPIKLSS